MRTTAFAVLMLLASATWAWAQPGAELAPPPPASPDDEAVAQDGFDLDEDMAPPAPGPRARRGQAAGETYGQPGCRADSRAERRAERRTERRAAARSERRTQKNTEARPARRLKRAADDNPTREGTRRAGRRGEARRYAGTEGGGWGERSGWCERSGWMERGPAQGRRGYSQQNARESRRQATRDWDGNLDGPPARGRHAGVCPWNEPRALKQMGRQARGDFDGPPPWEGRGMRSGSRGMGPERGYRQQESAPGHCCFCPRCGMLLETDEDSDAGFGRGYGRGAGQGYRRADDGHRRGYGRMWSGDSPRRRPRMMFEDRPGGDGKNQARFQRRFEGPRGTRGRGDGQAGNFRGHGPTRFVSGRPGARFV